VYLEISEQIYGILQDLRRKLPVTRTLFPWQNTLQFSLTREVEKELGLGK
jgi:capping protein alpha